MLYSLPDDAPVISATGGVLDAMASGCGGERFEPKKEALAPYLEFCGARWRRLLAALIGNWELLRSGTVVGFSFGVHLELGAGRVYPNSPNG